jgi:putative phosphoribosyl transferase
MNDSAGEKAEEQLVEIPAGAVTLKGNLILPKGSRALVLLARGSASSRHSPRDRYVARLLNGAKLATLLIDLLTPHEELIDMRTAQLRFDINLLAERLVGATDWLSQFPDTGHFRIGYIGAGTVAAGSLVAAALRPNQVIAVVSRSGRPDLAGAALMRVQVATLLIVGEHDAELIEPNRAALAQLRGEKQLATVPGATHFFEEPGALEIMAQLASDWFERHLVAVARATTT